MLRESILALLIAFFFQYFGRIFFTQLEISDYTLKISGGILLLIVALNMIFSPSSSTTSKKLKQEPLIVPIATPLISGPALLTIIMSYSKQEGNNLKISLAIAISWVAVTAVLVTAPYLQRILGRRGLVALEQLMGLFLAMMAIGMIVKGLKEFINLIILNSG